MYSTRTHAKYPRLAHALLTESEIQEEVYVLSGGEKRNIEGFTI